MTDVVTILESGMTFSVPRAELFHIEPYVQEKIGVKTVEFVWLQNQKMKFVEAKSSAPMPNNAQALREYIDSISEKWLNSVHITAGKALGEKIGKPFDLLSWDEIQINLYLVLGNQFKKEWLPPLQNAFNASEKLRAWQKVWNPSNPAWIKVLNEEMARKAMLISSSNNV